MITLSTNLKEKGGTISKRNCDNVELDSAEK